MDESSGRSTAEAGPGGQPERTGPLPPVRRTAATQYETKQVDHGRRSDLIRMLVWSAVGGVPTVPVGVGLHLNAATQVLMFVVAAAFTFGVVTLLREGAAGLALNAVAPSGKSTPYKHDYSQAKSYEVRGHFAEAVRAFELGAETYPDDPEPCLHLARIYRDELKELHKSVEWFRQALTVATDVKTQNIAIRELADVFVKRMAEPKRALPDLARFAERHAGTPTGVWARAEIAEIKKELSWEA